MILITNNFLVGYMEGSKQKLLSNLLKRDESIIGIIVAEKDSAIPVLSSYSPTCSETVDRHRPFIGSTITLMKNSNKLGWYFIDSLDKKLVCNFFIINIMKLI